jgi:hypothetical protein
MQLARPAIAAHPFRFGRGPVRELAAPAFPGRRISDDAKLFATTFLAGFVFVSILLA